MGSNPTSQTLGTLCVMAISVNYLRSDFQRNYKYVIGVGIVVKKRIYFLLSLLGICFALISTGCSSTRVTGFPEEMDKIKVEVVSRSELPDGTAYSIKLSNGSPFLIKQNNVYISYPFRTGNNGTSLNKAKIEAEGNKIDIRSGDEVILNAFIPVGIFDSNKVDLSILQYEIKGFIEEVKDINKFARLGDVLD